MKNRVLSVGLMLCSMLCGQFLAVSANASSIDSAVSTDNTGENNIVSKSNDKGRSFYVSASGGIAFPVIKVFTEDVTVSPLGKYKFYGKIKETAAYSVSAGYYIDPSIAMEFSFTHLHKIPFTFLSAEVPGSVYLKSKGVHAKSYMLNFVYHMKEYGRLQPYATFGGGLAVISPIASSSKFYNDLATFALTNKKAKTFIGQMGVGALVSLNDHIALDFGAKFKYINNAKLHFNVSIPNQDDVTKSVKKAIGVVDVMVGVRVSL